MEITRIAASRDGRLILYSYPWATDLDDDSGTAIIYDTVRQAVVARFRPPWGSEVYPVGFDRKDHAIFLTSHVSSIRRWKAPFNSEWECIFSLQTVASERQPRTEDTSKQ